MNMFSLKDRVALVTGGNGLIATAKCRSSARQA
jgi:NAD(P)-dependent dehydrogenase (short-subunit alcohol dehydrogenase family)